MNIEELAQIIVGNDDDTISKLEEVIKKKFGIDAIITMNVDRKQHLLTLEKCYTLEQQLCEMHQSYEYKDQELRDTQHKMCKQSEVITELKLTVEALKKWLSDILEEDTSNGTPVAQFPYNWNKQRVLEEVDKIIAAK